MNLVELTDDLRIEVGASGSTITTVEGRLPLEVQRLARTVRQAWVDIQTEHRDWTFRRIDSTDVMEVGQAIQSPTELAAEGVADWYTDTFRFAEPGEGMDQSGPMHYLEWDIFRQTHGLDATERGRPLYFSVRPDKTIAVARPPDKAYPFWYDYVRAVQLLRRDKDAPYLPADYHTAIIYKAKMLYGAYEDDPGMFDHGQGEYRRWLQKLEAAFLPGLDTITLWDS